MLQERQEYEKLLEGNHVLHMKGWKCYAIEKIIFSRSSDDTCVDTCEAATAH